jgi:hypothetical protein
MKQDEIIEIATKVWGKCDWHESALCHLEAFAKLVAAKEREALTPRCWTAKMNDAWNKSIPDLTLAFDELIRARSGDEK